VTVVDPSEVEYTSMDSAYQNDPVCLVGLRLHILTRGWQFDLRSRCASAPKSQPNPAEALAT
jgi:cyanophycinase